MESESPFLPAMGGTPQIQEDFLQNVAQICLLPHHVTQYLPQTTPEAPTLPSVAQGGRIRAAAQGCSA